MKTFIKALGGAFFIMCCTSFALADDDATSIQDAFSKGEVSGSLKTYYFAQTFDADA